MPDKQRSPGKWFLGGCLLFIVGVCMIMASAFLWGRSAITSVVEDQMNPEAREKKAKELLGADTLPAGYHAAVGTMSVGIVKSVRLTDKTPAEGDSPLFKDRGFVYNDSIRSSTSKVDDYIAGKSGNVLDEMGTRVRADESLRDGDFEINGQQVDYHVRRGELSEGSEAVPGLMTIFRFKCPDNRDRWAVWFERVPSDTPTSEITGADSVADEAAMRDFLGHFHVCGK